jgi:hypothetical protein
MHTNDAAAHLSGYPTGEAMLAESALARRLMPQNVILTPRRWSDVVDA